MTCITPAQTQTVEWIKTGREFSNLLQVHSARVQMLGTIAVVQVDWELEARPGNDKGYTKFRYMEVVAVDMKGRQNGLSTTAIYTYADGRQEVDTDAERVLPDNSSWE